MFIEEARGQLDLDLRHAHQALNQSAVEVGKGQWKDAILALVTSGFKIAQARTHIEYLEKIAYVPQDLAVRVPQNLPWAILLQNNGCTEWQWTGGSLEDAHREAKRLMEGYSWQVAWIFPTCQAVKHLQVGIIEPKS